VTIGGMHVIFQAHQSISLIRKWTPSKSTYNNVRGHEGKMQ